MHWVVYFGCTADLSEMWSNEDPSQLFQLVEKVRASLCEAGDRPRIQEHPIPDMVKVTAGTYVTPSH